MLKSELEQQNARLKDKVYQLERTNEILKKESSAIEQEYVKATERERNLLINLVAIQYSKKVKRTGPNGEKYEEIIIPDLDGVGWRPTRHDHRII